LLLSTENLQEQLLDGLWTVPDGSGWVLVGPACHDEFCNMVMKCDRVIVTVTVGVRVSVGVKLRGLIFRDS